MTTGPLIHSTPAVDPALAAAPYLTFGTSPALSGEISVDATALSTFPDRDIRFQWNSVNNREFRIDNIGAGAGRLGLNGAINANDVMTIYYAAFNNLLGLRGSRILTANAGNLQHINAAANLDLAGFNATTFAGLYFSPVLFDTVGGGMLTNSIGLNVGTNLNAIITTYRLVNLPALLGALAPATVVGVDIGNMSSLFGGVSYGVRIGDFPNDPVARGLELGPTPYLRLLMSGEWVPTANQTPFYLAEGVAPTLRNVQWVDPGAAGINLVAGQRVMVLV